jgi:hypothetical protein
VLAALAFVLTYSQVYETAFLGEDARRSSAD